MAGELDDIDRGLDAHGHIRRECRLELIPPSFTDAVRQLETRAAAAYGDRLHSLYLYGSVPRGTASPGRSDLDALVVLAGMPHDSDYALARELEASLDSNHTSLHGVGLLVFSRARLMHPSELYDMGFFLACLCSPPVYGVDLAMALPSYEPCRELARATNGNIALSLNAVRRQLAAASGPERRQRLCRSLARKLVRTAFTLVMPRWGGWTSDLGTIGRIVAAYYPHQAAAMTTAIQLANTPSAEQSVMADLLDGFGEWLVGEYDQMIGRKPSRENPS